MIRVIDSLMGFDQLLEGCNQIYYNRDWIDVLCF